MSTITMAWEAFLAAIAEAQSVHAAGAKGTAIQDLLQHARELLDIISDELTLTGASLPEWPRNGLEQLRERLIAVESELVTRH
jgi:hypothetical protein